MDFDIGTFLTGGGAGAGIFGTFLFFELKARGIFTKRITELESALRDAHKETIECAELRGQVKTYPKIEALHHEMLSMMDKALKNQTVSLEVLHAATIRPPSAQSPLSLEPGPMPQSNQSSNSHFFGSTLRIDDAENDTPSIVTGRPPIGPVETSPQTPLAKKARE